MSSQFMPTMASETLSHLDVEKKDLSPMTSPTLETDSEKTMDPFEVSMEPPDDPKSLPLWRRWVVAVVINTGAICVTGASSMAASAKSGVAAEWNVSMEVATLAVTLFAIGLGTGPLLVAPLAGILGQRVIYLGSFVLMWVFNWPVAFANSIAVHLIFRFFCGICGSAFLSIGGGTVSDLFTYEEVGTPMAAYTISTFFGPVITPVFSGFIMQNAGWRWLYRVLLIWQFVQTFALLLIPETNRDVILKRKAAALRKSTGDSRYFAPTEREKTNLVRAIGVRIWHIFELIIYDRMALLLDIWTSLILGILYLVFQVFPIIFKKHGFDAQQTGLTFLGVATGLVIAMVSQVFWNRYRVMVACKYNNNPHPEVWLAMGKVGAILVPISLYCLAFTTYTHVHWIAPIISSVPFGVGICYVYTSVFTYLVTAFKPIAAEALTGNAVMRTSFAAAFPLFSTAMYNRLGTVGATALLAGLMTIMAPLPFIFDRVGGRLREASPFAVHCPK